MRPPNLNSWLRLVVAKWTFAVWFHAVVVWKHKKIYPLMVRFHHPPPPRAAAPMYLIRDFKNESGNDNGNSFLLIKINGSSNSSNEILTTLDLTFDVYNNLNPPLSYPCLPVIPSICLLYKDGFPGWIL